MLSSILEEKIIFKIEFKFHSDCKLNVKEKYKFHKYKCYYASKLWKKLITKKEVH